MSGIRTLTLLATLLSSFSRKLL